MTILTPRDRQLLAFVRSRMGATGSAPTFQAMRLRFGLKSEEHAKKAFTDLIEHLTQVELRGAA